MITNLVAGIGPGLRATGVVVRAGGVLGAVTGLVSGGFKCVQLQREGSLSVGDAATVLGRDISTGFLSGLGATAVLVQASAAGAVVGAVISAPAWVPSAAAIALALVAGQVVAEGVHIAWDHWTE
jgi:hypothetical protein